MKEDIKKKKYTYNREFNEKEFFSWQIVFNEAYFSNVRKLINNRIYLLKLNWINSLLTWVKFTENRL